MSEAPLPGARCAETSYEGRISFRCGRIAKIIINGRPMCGLHAAGARRSAATRDRWTAEFREYQQKQEEAQTTAVNLSISLATAVQPFFAYSLGGGVGHYDPERYVVTRAFLEGLTHEE